MPLPCTADHPSPECKMSGYFRHLAHYYYHSPLMMLALKNLLTLEVVPNSLVILDIGASSCEFHNVRLYKSVYLLLDAALQEQNDVLLKLV